tara:strand:+ start:779 stop:1093 length:315 start_codon:yes stop_codon:yes gene_type:complete
MQSKRQSFIESLTNLAVGYTISLISLFLIFPIMGIESSMGKNVIITCYFTVISLARSYIIRRYFNKKIVQNERKQELIALKSDLASILYKEFANKLRKSQKNSK